RGLTSQATLDAWLAANGLSARPAYAGFLAGWMAFTHCLSPLSCDLFGVAELDVTRNWFLETLHECGLDGAPEAEAELRRRWAQLDEPARDAFARACDLDGTDELERELGGLR